MKHLRVGLVGAGFAARLHVEAWRRVHGIDVDLVTVAAGHPDRATAFARDFGIGGASGSFDELLTRDVDVVDICTPNHLHAPYARAALGAGRHVVVEKPLTGCFVPHHEMTPVAMLEHALREADAVIAAQQEAQRWCMYAENWVYAPPTAKAAALLADAGGTLLRFQGEESHSGTHAEPNKHWVTAGGGALFGKGCHPLGAALHLKREEARRTGRRIRPAAVVAHTASLTKLDAFAAEDPKYLRTGYEDVEDYGLLVCTFDDGTIAEIVGADTTLGGVRNRFTAYASNVVVEANLNPNTAVRAYAPDPSVLADSYLSEKLETHGGWTLPSPDEDWMQGYPQEMQDFAEAVVEDRPPRSDAQLGRDVLAVIYGAYLSAAEGRRVDLTPYLPATS